jgi:DNA-3-methyladenine glycosylase
VSPGPAGRPAKRLARAFFNRPALQVAPELLGCVLWHDTPEGRVAAEIVEVEAYAGHTDPASHAFRGRTARNAVMFGPPGHAYVYFTYGMHFCVNLVCAHDGPSAVLLRAGRITEGAALAGRRRAAGRDVVVPERNLARGPATLCQALDIDLALDGADVCTDSPLQVGRPADWTAPPAGGISAGPRVGISQAQDRPWRFWLTGERHVSAYKAAKPRRAAAKPVAARGRRDGTMHR